MTSEKYWFDVRDCPKCGADRGSSCRTPGCVQLGLADEQELPINAVVAPKPTTIYVVQESGGDYDDYWTVARCAFYSKSDAEKYVSEKEHAGSIQLELKTKVREFSRAWQKQHNAPSNFRVQARAAELEFCRSLGMSDGEAIPFVSSLWVKTENTWDFEELELS